MAHSFSGTHIIADLYGVKTELIYKESELKSVIENGIIESGAHLIKTVESFFDNGGFTLVSLLKESHVSVHTYPEFNALFIDVFTCGDINAMKIIEQIKKYFLPTRMVIKTIHRGFTNNAF